MQIVLKYFLFLFLPLLTYGQLKHRTEFVLLMGSRFEITPYAQSDSLVEQAISSTIQEVKRIEQIISEWIPESEISEVNRMSGIKPVKVSKELFDIVKRSLKVSQLTDGAFDISWAAARNVWHFDKSLTKLPNQKIIDTLIPLINYKNIVLNDSLTTIYLKEKGMAIGLGAMGKGYAANKSKELMQKMGIDNGIVIAGGDLITWGSPEKSVLWPIGIANPNMNNEAIAWFEIGEMAVVTSGDYERFVIIENKRYGHILDPRTCMPVTGLKSVTIVCFDAEIADALATSVFVLGLEKGMSLVNQLKGVECVIIDDNNKFYTSHNLALNTETKNPDQVLTIGKK